MNRIYFVLFTLFCFIIIFGCSTESDNTPIPFIVRVDNLSHPSSVAIGDTFAIQLFGTIGSDGCHSFSHFEDLTQPLQLDLIVWGQRIPDSACPTVMVYLNGKEYSVAATQQGLYFINIHQPDGSVLRDSLTIN